MRLPGDAGVSLCNQLLKILAGLALPDVDTEASAPCQVGPERLQCLQCPQSPPHAFADERPAVPGPGDEDAAAGSGGGGGQSGEGPGSVSRSAPVRCGIHVRFPPRGPARCPTRVWADGCPHRPPGVVAEGAALPAVRGARDRVCVSVPQPGTPARWEGAGRQAPPGPHPTAQSPQRGRPGRTSSVPSPRLRTWGARVSSAS